MPFDHGHAVCIGISEYAGKARLPATVAEDAGDVAALLQDAATCGYAPGRVHLLQNGSATKAAMLSTLADVAGAAAPTDTVVIFFSGHGARVTRAGATESYLIPVDFSGADIGGSCISNAELTAALRAIRAGRIVMLMDACHSGAAAEPKDVEALVQGKLGFGDTDYSGLAVGAGRVVVASSRPEEYSYVHAGAPNSVFTDAVLRALRGEAAIRGDGFVRVFDVFHYVSEHVPAIEPRQHPIFKGTDVETNFPLALFQGGQKGINRPAATLPRGDEWWRRLEDLVCTLYPTGPTDNEFWSRAGGDVAQLRVSQSPRGSWHAALRTLRQGGGGPNIGLSSLFAIAKADYPTNATLEALQSSAF